MTSIVLPLHGDRSNASVHRQLMLDAARGRGFRPDFMQRTMVDLGMAPLSFLRPERSKRSLKKAAARAAYLARCKAQQSVNVGDRAGVTLRVQRNMIDRMLKALG